MQSNVFPKPRFSAEARYLLNEYYVNIRASYGSPRILNTIFEIARNIARLKLKQEVDAADAEETMEFYNYILLQLDKVVSLPSDPRDIVYEQCLEILRESRFPILFEELIDSACDRNPQVDRYLGPRRKLRDNKKLRPILEMLQNNSRVRTVQMKPVVLEYIHDQPVVEAKAKEVEQACDPCDPCDHTLDPYNKNENKNNEEKYFSEVSEGSEVRAHRSHRSHSTYEHLITEEYLPSLERWVYRCKEHPSIPYYDLKGIEVSHFEPYHI